MTYITRIANKRIFAKICLLSFRSIIPIITFYLQGRFSLARAQLAMRMAQIGHIEQFNRDTNDLSMYIKRVQFCVDANGISDAKKKAALLSLVGPDTFKILSSLLVPERPTETCMRSSRRSSLLIFAPIGVRFTLTQFFTSVFRRLACQLWHTCQSYS